MDHYRFLGVSRTASQEEIKAAYHRLAKRWHPDKNSPERRQEATRRFQDLSKAYSVLKEEERRRAYDATLGGPGGDSTRKRSYDNSSGPEPEDAAGKKGKFEGDQNANVFQPAGIYSYPQQWIPQWGGTTAYNYYGNLPQYYYYPWGYTNPFPNGYPQYPVYWQSAAPVYTPTYQQPPPWNQQAYQYPPTVPTPPTYQYPSPPAYPTTPPTATTPDKIPDVSSNPSGSGRSPEEKGTEDGDGSSDSESSDGDSASSTDEEQEED